MRYITTMEGMKYCVRGLMLVLMPLLLTAQQAGQDWTKATSLAAVDMTGLAPPQRARALKLLRELGCSCGCDMKLAECRVRDPGCSYSTNLSAVVVESVKAGRSDADTLTALKASPWAHVQQAKLLDDPIELSTYGAPARGPVKAPITLVEFSDFQCPYCAIAIGQLDALLRAYPTQVRLVFKQFPLDTHPQAALAAAAAVAAEKQGKFWAMHDALFAHRGDLSRPAILALAKEQGLDTGKFASDWDSTETRETVVRDVQDGERARVEGTPTVFVNGQRFNGQITTQALGSVISDQLKVAQKTPAPRPGV